MRASTLFKITLATLLGLLAVVGIMGKRFTPWMATARQTAQQKLEQLVDRYRYQLNQAEQAVQEAQERSEGLRDALVKASIATSEVENRLKVARRERDQARSGLESLEHAQAAGLPVSSGSGRELTAEEVTFHIDRRRQAAALAEEKIRMLETFLARRQQRKQKLESLHRRLPLELARLRMSVRYLADKVKLYEEQRALFAEEQDAEVACRGLLEEASQTLESAHIAIDTELSRFDAMLDATLEVQVGPREALSPDGDLAIRPAGPGETIQVGRR